MIHRFLPAFALTVSATAVLAGCGMGHDEGAGDHHGDGGDDHHESVIGEAGDPAAVDRTVRVAMDDTMAYSPSSIEVESGQTIRFDVVNEGKLRHEFVLGTPEEIAEHHELMKRFPGMEHDEPNSVSLAAGDEGTVTWKFGEAGTVEIACLQSGHYEAGMTGVVEVAAK